MIEALEKMLADGQDNALLRFSLGQAYIERDASVAVTHLRRALEFDPEYSAAWKLLGKAATANDDLAAAESAYTQGIAVAEQRGDIQAAKEMRVFLKRLQKNAQD